MGLGIARVLHAVGPLAAQQLDQQADEGLRPCPHHDLVRVCPDAPEPVEVLGDGLPQLGHALGMGSGEEPVLLLGQHLPHQLGPGGEGEEGGVHPAGGEIPPEGRPAADFPRLRLEGGLRRSGLLGPCLDKKALPGLGPEVALRQQLLVGALHRHHTDLQMGGQGPVWRAGGSPPPDGRPRSRPGYGGKAVHTTAGGPRRPEWG